MQIHDVKMSDAKLWLMKLHNDGRGYSTVANVRNEGCWISGFERLWRFMSNVTVISHNVTKTFQQICAEYIKTWVQTKNILIYFHISTIIKLNRVIVCPAAWNVGLKGSIISRDRILWCAYAISKCKFKRCIFLIGNMGGKYGFGFVKHIFV